MKTYPKSRSFKSKALFTIVGGAVLINPALAQDTKSSELEEVVVTGMRESLRNSMEIKRDAFGVVDAISAEDIGKFPDTNLAESLQRIPGVSIDRTNGEGSQVTVRGFGPGYNLITLNGRTVPTAEVNLYGNRDNYSGGQGRSFDFSNIAAESVAGLEVYKTGQAILPSGGIGATINIQTRRPFDNPDTQATFAAKGIYDSSVYSGDSVTPELSGLFSWTNDNESLGFAVFGSYQKRDSGAAIGQTNDWVVARADDFFSNTSIVRAGGNPNNYTNAPADGELFAIPQDSRYDFSDLSKERLNGQFVAQFRPIDSMTLTLDYLFVDSESEELRYEQTNWFATPFDQLVFDGEGPVSQALFMQENNNGQKDMGFEQTYRAQKDEMDSVGFNAEWEINDHGTLRFDTHFDTAESTPNNPLGHSATFVTFAAPIIQQHSLSWDNSDGFPVQSYTFNDAVKGNNNGVIDVGDLGSQVSRSATNSQKMDVEEFDLRYSLDFDTSRLDFGANYRGTEVHVKSRTTQQDLGTWGVSNPRDIELYAPGVVETFCLSCRFDDYQVGQAQTAFRADATRLYSLLTPVYEDAGNAVSVATTDNTVEEDIMSFYAQFQVRSEFLNRPVTVNGGLRYEETDVKASALQSVPTGIRWTADNDFIIDYGSELQNVSGDGNYKHLLPNIDFRLDITDTVVGRMSYSQTIARAPYGNLFASTLARAPNNPTVLGGQTGGESQNPNLLPLESENFDISLEWYYGQDSYVSVGFFDKTVKNFQGDGVFTRPLFGLLDPTAGVPGSRSAAALGVIDTLAVDRSPANLFTMVALIDANNGNVAAAQAEFEANLEDGALPQDYVDEILALYDVTGNSSDPEMQFRVSQPINDKEGNIFGWELAFQHFFGASGFGVAGSYTIVNGDVEADAGSDPDANQFALVGLSDTANLTLMFENYGWSARLAYNWRDKFLNATNQGGSRSPQFTDDYGQIDASVSYDFGEHFQVIAEGINLTGEDHREYRRKEGMTVWAYELSPRYAIGARYKF
ncbi:TonB-dependent receptor [Povalibacter uvarum]|uniref:TonB-dependent receptor n=1 Tax=Povalibacter uvarum TaxID=732238 RepID=A0A841HIM4_9GAMM|nr:TonB-dependent receptor [Povalibacter uvarum]MBB6092434.1 TonB-dependent receptor [Povalibacter uvarum]